MNAPGTVRKPGGHRLRTVSRESRLIGVLVIAISARYLWLGLA